MTITEDNTGAFSFFTGAEYCAYTVRLIILQNQRGCLILLFEWFLNTAIHNGEYT